MPKLFEVVRIPRRGEVYGMLAEKESAKIGSNPPAARFAALIESDGSADESTADRYQIISS